MRRFLKIFFIILGGIFSILLIAILWLNTSSGKNFVRTRVLSYLRGKLKTEVYIQELGYGLPKYIELKNVILKDQQNDTLLAIRDLRLDINMLRLIYKHIDVGQLTLEGITAHVYRNKPDTNFNYSYIISAFSSPVRNPNVKDTSSSGFDFNIRNVVLKDVRLRYDDHTGGSLYAVSLDDLELKTKEIDFKKMRFKVKSLALSGLRTSIILDSSSVRKTADTGRTNLNLVADIVDMHNVVLRYNDHVSRVDFGIDLTNLKLQLNKFDLSERLLNIKTLALDTTKSFLVLEKNGSAPPIIDTIVKIDTTEGWRIVTGNIDLSQVNFKMDNENVPHITKGMDYSHLGVQNLDLKGRNILYTSDTIKGDIVHLAATEQCGFKLNEFRSRFAYYAHGGYLQNLYLQTPGTLIQNYAEIRYPSLDILKKHFGYIQVKVNIIKSVVDIKDILVFAPQLQDQKVFQKYKNTPFKLEAQMDGFVNALNIKNFYFAGLEHTEIAANGELSGLPDADRIKYDLHFSKAVSCSNDINTFLSDSIIAQVRIPDRLSVSGTVKGTKLSYYPDLILSSSDGNASVKGMLEIPDAKDAQKYDLQIGTQNFNIGHILRRDTLFGMLSAEMIAKGKSFDIHKIEGVLNAKIALAQFKGYDYKQITIDGKILAHIGDIKLISNDTNVHLQLNGNVDLSKQFAAIKADLNIDNLDFHALKLSDSGLSIKGLIHTDIAEMNPDYPNGLLVWRNPGIISSGKKYSTDSLYVLAKSREDTGQNIVGELDAIHFTLSGKTPLTKIGYIVEDHIKRHYQFKRDTTKTTQIASAYKTDTTQIPSDYKLDFKAIVENRPSLHAFFPELTSLKPINIEASMSPRFINVRADVPHVQYGSSIVENAKVLVDGADSAFTYKVTIDQIAQNQMQLWYANIHGDLDQNIITTNVSIADADKKEQFALVASLTSDSSKQVLHLEPKLKLNYENWQVSPDNKLVFASAGFYAQNFQISFNNESIKLNSEQQMPKAPLSVDISNFYLDDISQILSRDTTLFAGVLSGNARIEKWSPSLVVSSKIQIKDLTVMEDTLGDLAAELNCDDHMAINSKIDITGRGNNVSITGNYYVQQNNGNDFSGDIEFKPLNVASVEGFAFKQVNHSSGEISGKLHIQGTASSPTVEGELTTNKVVTTIAKLNSVFKFPSNKIVFTNGGLSLNNFEILDSANNRAVISGTLVTKNLKDIRMDMNIKADNWKAIHSTYSDNKMFYGDMLLTANISASGSVTQPNIDGEVKMLKGTSMTYVMPEKNPEIQSSAGVVEFVNVRDTGWRRLFKVKTVAKDTNRIMMNSGSDMNVNITIDKNAELNLILDQAAGDFIRVKGDATLNAATNSSGEVQVTGIYNLHEGAYQMNYNFIKRKFSIQDGSSIIFAGDPLKAKADITAIYEADVAPYDLIQREVPDQAQLNYYKERLPFNVELHLKGSVLQPNITFNILLPDNKVYPLSSDQIELIRGKLSQIRMDTSELNKQVFALLILSRFVTDDPFTSGSSQGISTAAIQSVSGFIGQQLNQLTNNIIKGVDLSVDLATTEDYTTGEMRNRTDLNIAASKRLLNDRLKLTIGNDFELQGPQATPNSAQDAYIPSNLAADYLLSPDGRYTVRAYRKNYDAGVLEGYITQSGLNFIVSLDYNHFKNVFKKRHANPQTTAVTQ